MRSFTLLITTLSLIACEPKEEDQYTFVLEDELGNPSGCSDFLFFDSNEDDSIVLEFQGQGLAEAAHTNGESQTIEYDLEELPEELRLEVNFGTNLSHALCNDALDPTIESVVNTSYIPVNGTLNILVTPNGEPSEVGEYPAEIQIQIQQADFCSDTGGGEPHHEDCFNVSSYSGSAFIGWLPG